MVTIRDKLKIRNMEIKNRFGFPAMMSNSCKNGVPTEENILVYELKAKGGVGIITYEASTVIAFNMGVQPNMGLDANVPAFKVLTDRIHKYDTKIGMQLVEGGILTILFAAPAIAAGMNIPVKAPSSVDPLIATSAMGVMNPGWEGIIKKHNIQIQELTVAEIAEIQGRMAKGAKRAVDAGFDFIEIHSCHGSLYFDFLSPFYNQRTDEYGGSLENKTRFVRETIEKMRQEIGDEIPIFVRISADELLEDGLKIEDSTKIAQLLEKAGVDCLDISMGVMVRTPHGITIPTYFDQGSFIHLPEAIKKVVNIPVIGVGRITKPEMADKFIQEGKADIINFGRGLIADAEMPNKYLSGRSDEIKTCFGCLIACTRGNCVYDPYSGPFYKEITPAEKPKKIVILGGGIAGMEAARISKKRGHFVELFEKSHELGGLMPIVAAEYKKQEYTNISDWLKNQLNLMEVSINVGKSLSKEDITALNPDVLVFAIGTEPSVPVKYQNNPAVLTQDDAIMKTKPLGKNIVLWGLDTYWRGGTETAITLIEQGYNVKALVGKEKVIAGSIAGVGGRYFWILEYLKKKETPIFYGAKLENVSDGKVIFTDSEGNEQSIEADSLVYCGSRISSRKTLEKEFEGVAPEVVFLGDCKQPGDIRNAMKDAHDFARNV